MANAYTVIKIGSEKVDALHALGLSVVLAWSSNAECRIINYGQEYSLKFSTKRFKPKGLENLFDEVLKLPDNEFLKL